MSNKKVLALMAAAALAAALALVGCGGSQASSASSASDAAASGSENSAAVESSAAAESAQAEASSSAEAASSAAAQDSTAYIGDDAAKAAALEHANVAEADCVELSVGLDTDDANVHYDVEFKVGNTEYEYDIDPVTGNVLFSNAEVDD